MKKSRELESLSMLSFLSCMNSVYLGKSPSILPAGCHYFPHNEESWQLFAIVHERVFHLESLPVPKVKRWTNALGPFIVHHAYSNVQVIV